jgi:hypothetical protein
MLDNPFPGGKQQQRALERDLQKLLAFQPAHRDMVSPAFLNELYRIGRKWRLKHNGTGLVFAKHGAPSFEHFIGVFSRILSPLMYRQISYALIFASIADMRPAQLRKFIEAKGLLEVGNTALEVLNAAKAYYPALSQIMAEVEQKAADISNRAEA